MIDDNHPRALSLKIRDQIVWGVERGLTSLHGLVAQGRGEAFDYLIGEKTQQFAQEAITAAAAQLLLAEYPVLSVNGNSAALSGEAYVRLANLLNCPIEVNLFHRTPERETKRIYDYLKQIGVQHVMEVGTDASEEITGIASLRRFVSPDGIKKADVVFVPLEDGDRTEHLIKIGKKVITIDLNPLSRTAQKATITIVDNIVRALPLLTETVTKHKKTDKKILRALLAKYDNREILLQAIKEIRGTKNG